MLSTYVYATLLRPLLQNRIFDTFLSFNSSHEGLQGITRRGYAPIALLSTNGPDPDHTHCITYPHNTCSQRVSAVSVSVVVKLTSAHLKGFLVQLYGSFSLGLLHSVVRTPQLPKEVQDVCIRSFLLARSDCYIWSAVFDTAEWGSWIMRFVTAA
jgi:hypothetical protein